MARARLVEIELPGFGMPDSMPEIPAAVYAARLERLRARMDEHGYDRLVVYADREHSANLAYLTGFDPRFEEALAVIGPDGEPGLLVGNECYGMAAAAPVAMRRVLSQDLSLPSQPRDRSRPLRDILADEGIGAGVRVGVVGWKTYARPEAIDAPAYVVDELRAMVGPGGSVVNATGLLIDAADGLRVINEVEQLAAFEWAACQTSQGIRRLLAGLRPGMTEREAVRLLDWNGMPLSCHLMLTAGPRAALGLLSPGDRRIERGDPFTVAFGIWGALDCRAGFVVEDANELPAGIVDYVERLVAPYFETVTEWYGALRVGQVGGTLQEIVDRRLSDPFFGIFLNAGHQIGLDEWVNSPIFPGSTTELRSGMALQVDIIPATGTDHFTTNIEDGVALADEALRSAFASADPAAWATDPGTPPIHGRSPGHRPPPGRAPVLEHAGLPAAVPAPTRPGDDRRRLGGTAQARLSGEGDANGASAGPDPPQHDAPGADGGRRLASPAIRAPRCPRPGPRSRRPAAAPPASRTADAHRRRVARPPRANVPGAEPLQRGRRPRSPRGCAGCGPVRRRAGTAARRDVEAHRPTQRGQRVRRSPPFVTERRVGRHQEAGEVGPRCDRLDERVVRRPAQGLVEVLHDRHRDAGRASRASRSSGSSRSGGAWPRMIASGWASKVMTAGRASGRGPRLRRRASR